MHRAHIVIVGAGPGGLTAAMILAHRGFRVTVFEKRPFVGGRNAPIQLGPYTFDTGPTFLMMRFILDEVFSEAGENSDELLDFVLLDPMYRLSFPEFDMEMTNDREQMRRQIAEHFPGCEAGLDAFMEREQKRFEHLFPCLQKPYLNLGAYFAPIFLKAIPHLGGLGTVFSNMQKYFSDERLTTCFTFQSKYLGMSPWTCPAAFSMLPYIEHAYGIYHVQGGLSEISSAMAKVVEGKGGEVCMETAVRRVLVEEGRAAGVELESGEQVRADEVVINADFGHAVSNLVESRHVRKWTPARLEKKKWSCSTFMLYLGLDTVFDMPHHTIVFADDYRENIRDITERMVLSDDMSFYVRNSSVTDPRVAPAGKSAVYVLVPVPNCRAGIDWASERDRYRKAVIDAMEARTPMTDIRSHIEEERVIVPDEWATDYDVYIGATFNLAHSLNQLLILRPGNRFGEFGNCYLVGGGTHPGSGLPTIYESGRIAANLISAEHNVAFEPPSPLSTKFVHDLSPAPAT